MGVPLLLTWLRSSFARCFYPAEGELSKSIRGNIDNLYIDLNSLLYQSSMIVSMGRGHFRSVEEVEDAVLRKLYDLLDDIIFHLVQPVALVYVAVDGISPLGKMSQQRSRRQRQSHRRHTHTHRRHFEDDNEPTTGPGAKTETMDSLWDNNCITVGTRFMAKATEALHAYAVSRAERMNVRRLQEYLAASAKSGTTAAPSAVFTPLAIVIDDVLRPGEGENKILEVIRRFREQPDYNPNLVHAVCSSDTDVTVSSLLLHEPRMFVLRYEPPPSLGGKPPAPKPVGKGPHGSSGGGSGDSWLSTFFSIYLFREGLRKTLGLAPVEVTLDAATAMGGRQPANVASGDPMPPTPAVSAEVSAAFERALHDVVFVMLLFGNDFLPALGGSIQEGTLDALLSLLASDFVSRGMTVIDPETNHIHFSSARYLLDCLSDIRGHHPGGVLSVHGGGGGGGGRGRGGGGGRQNNHGHQRGPSGNETNSSGAIGSDWGFTDDPEFQRRKQEKEKRLERQCYCYWTMLQWALQYSAGIVDHWGCYYPFSSAPPLYALRKYCGVLSYDALVKFVASRHAARQAGQDVEDLELPMMPTVTDEETAVAAAAAAAAEGEEVRTRLASKPTAAMVQLLVLTPQSSSTLLPTVFRNAYAEIATVVQAPVEELDIDFVERWCDEKKRLLSEEERTRFDAYHLFASSDPLPLAKGVVGESASPGEPPRHLPANEATFIAYWDGDALAKELAETARAAQAKAQQAAAAAADPPAPPLPTRNVASFFGARKGKGPGAAAAALLQAPVAPPPSPVAAAESVGPAVREDGSAALASFASGGLTAAVSLVTNPINSIFFFAGLPKAYLPTDGLVKAMGYLDGPRFVIGAAISSNGGSSSISVGGGGIAGHTPALSRDSTVRQVRLQWRVAVASVPPTMPERTATPPADGAEGVAAGVTSTARTNLLTGYVPPGAEATLSVTDIITAKRTAEEEHAALHDDPWQEMESKRQRTEGSDSVSA